MWVAIMKHFGVKDTIVNMRIKERSQADLDEVGWKRLHGLQVGEHQGLEQGPNPCGIPCACGVLGRTQAVGYPSHAGDHGLAARGALGGSAELYSRHLAKCGTCRAAVVVHVHPHCACGD